MELRNARLEVKELREKTAQHATNEQTSRDLAEQLQAQLDATRADNQTLKRKMQSAKSDKVSFWRKMFFNRFPDQIFTLFSRTS